MTKYIRIKNGECSFTIIEEFDSIEKAANSSNEGTNAEVKIENVKLDFTTVKKEHDGRHQSSSSETEGSSSEETRQVPRSEAEGQ